MIESIAKSFEALVLEFTWRRLVAVILYLILAFGVMTIFDWYTGYFSLGRLEKTEALMEKLVKIEPSILRSPSVELRTLHSEMISKLREPASATESAPYGNIPMPILKKFTAGIVLWLLFSLMFIPNIKNENNWAGIFGAWVVGILFGVLAQLIPDSWATLLPLSLYSIATFLIAILFTMAWQKRLNARNINHSA